VGLELLFDVVVVAAVAGEAGVVGNGTEPLDLCFVEKRGRTSDHDGFELGKLINCSDEE
jgi:hypothetical protein